MHPVLMTIGQVPVRMYTVMAVLAMMGSMIVVRSEARRYGLNVREISWVVVACTLLGFVGAHILYAFTRTDLSGAAWWRTFFNFGYGGVWFGGFLASWGLAEWYARFRKYAPLKSWDMGAFAVLIANPVGRIGCFFNGCCYGTPTSLPWGVVIPGRSEFGEVPLHPAPLYEFTYQMLLFAVLWSVRKRNKYDGQTAARYLILMPLGRFVLEFWRGDTSRGFFYLEWLSTSQVISVGLMLCGLALYLVRRRSFPDFKLF